MAEGQQRQALLGRLAALGWFATGSVGWQGREGDLQRLVDEATARFRAPGGRLLPLGLEPEFGYYRRYIPGGLPDPECYCSVGVVGGLADQGTPFWLRYHRDTSSYQTLAERIVASRFAADAVGDGGHIWLPLPVSGDRSGAAIVDELVEQIEEIAR